MRKEYPGKFTEATELSFINSLTGGTKFRQLIPALQKDSIPVKLFGLVALWSDKRKDWLNLSFGKAV